jgi:hypothetical protein
MTTPAAPPTDLKNALEELRASVAARATGKGLKGTIEDAILLFLGLLLKMVEDFRAGKLAPIAPPAKAAEPEDASPRLVRPAAQAAQGGDLSRGSGAGHSDASRRRIPRARIAGERTIAPRQRRGRLRTSGQAARSVATVRRSVRGTATHERGIVPRRSLPRMTFDRGISLRRWRNTPGVRRAFPPYRVDFSKMRIRVVELTRRYCSRMKTTG